LAEQLNPALLKKQAMKIIQFLAILAFLWPAGNGYAQAGNNSRVGITSFKVAGICGQCKDRIEAALRINGITTATWDLETQLLSASVDSARVSVEEMHALVAAAGHDTYLNKASGEVYNHLPACCRYREAGTIFQLDPANAGTGLGSPSASSGITQHAKSTRGIVLAEDEKGNFTPLAGASVVWAETGKGTATDEQGSFTILDAGQRLIISHAGFLPDTIDAFPENELKIVLATGRQLQEVKVNAYRASTYISNLDPYRTQVITQKELFKAACCNLSESFETNPSVDVSYNDAVTGSKQIQLLGLAGIYTQLTVENLPGPRGLATVLGLNSIPGTWIESIQLNKGTGSVANGYESIAGQINVELKKPATSEQLYANLYVNDFGRTDLNLNLTRKLGSKWATTLLLHNDYFNNKRLDMNKDKFRDLPTGNLFSAINRWSYDNGQGFITQFGVKLLDDQKTGGQVDYNPSVDKYAGTRYGLEINIKRLEGFAKIGYVFPGKKYQSIGLQLSAADHRQESYFGMTNYTARQKNLYSNFIYQSILHSTLHKFRTGLSVVYDEYDEMFNGQHHQRREMVPGAFFEYTFTPSAKFDLVAGVRQDHNNLYGWFTTPRLNMRYEPFKGTVVRVSIGRGQRTANIFAENNAVFASSRQVQILALTNGGAYGLTPEIAWNKGITIDQRFKLFNRPASFGIDFFRNDFTNQVVVDVENPRLVKFYNLRGSSYSNSLQVELSFTPFAKVDVKLAHRLFDVNTTYSEQLLQKPLTARNRSFANIGYEVKGWKFDYTASFSGRKRLPATVSNPPAFQRPGFSSPFVTMNAQVSKTLGKDKLVDVYVGGENLSNTYQHDAIIAASQPFSEYFDASMIWGLITGRMLYAGVRLKLK
jgi:copper chaperone CopZ